MRKETERYSKEDYKKTKGKVTREREAGGGGGGEVGKNQNPKNI